MSSPLSSLLSPFSFRMRDEGRGTSWRPAYRSVEGNVKGVWVRKRLNGRREEVKIITEKEKKRKESTE